MNGQSWIRRGLFVLSAAWLGLGIVSNASAQLGGGGVAIDAEGVLRRTASADPMGQLQRERAAQAQASLEVDVARTTPLRKVSLTRLEKMLAAQLADGRQPTAAMRHLAGLTRIQYVFYYPESHDVVIAGPAEGWMEDLSGRVVGLQTGRPTLLLEDLVVALRAFPPSGKNAGVVSCSIDPTPEGLAEMQKFLMQLGGRATPQQTQFIVDGLKSSLGLQIVTVGGISAKTHFAQVLVEADYRMKLIGIGLERPPVKLVSYVERANPAAVARNAMQRWYFVPNYESVRVSEDGLAIELVGEGVKLVDENEIVGADGSRRASGQVDRASHQFTTGFTQKYPELAKVAPVYAQLRNLIDLLVTAAAIQKFDFYRQAEWNLATLGNEKQVATEVHNAPQKVESAVNAMWRGNRLTTPIGGGVEIRAEQALATDNLLSDEEGKVKAAHAAIDLGKLPADRWWWD